MLDQLSREISFIHGIHLVPNHFRTLYTALQYYSQAHRKSLKRLVN